MDNNQFPNNSGVTQPVDFGMTQPADIDTDSADAFLDDVDDKLASMDVELSIDETAIKGQYKIYAVMLSDNPSSLNYIKLSYITLSDGTYNYSTVLKYDNDYSISEGKTCYTAYAALPLTEDKKPDFYDETSPFATDDPMQTPVTESPTISTPSHWKGNITVSLTIETHNDTSFSNWSSDFIVEY